MSGGASRGRGKAGRPADTTEGGTHPHFCPLDLPLVALALVATPFRLEEVEDGGEGVVLAALRGEGDLGGLGPLLLLGAGRALLLLLLAGRGLVGAGESAQHGELDGMRRGRILWWGFRVRSQCRAVDHPHLFGISQTT